MFRNNFFMVAVCMTALFSIANGIRCFQCNSANNSQCTNLEKWGKNREIRPVDCPVFRNEDLPFCRKTVLKILDKTKPSEARVIRSCGYIKYKRDCYSTDNEGHQEKVCQCFEDNCNSSTSNIPWTSLTVASLILIFFSNLNKFRIV